jgi:hypothetical protein
MFIKATSLLRSALLGAAVVAWTMPPAMAIDQGFAPRPDFPGAKQGEIHHHHHVHHHNHQYSWHPRVHRAS